MSNKIVYIEGANSITVSLDGKVYPVGKAHSEYARVVDAIRDADFSTLRTLLAPRAEMVRLSQGRLLLENGILTVGGRVLNDSFANRIMTMLKDGGNVEPLFLFLANLEENPSYRSRQETVGFVEACQLPFTDDGHFLAYKRVRKDWLDLHSGTMDNSVGVTVKMDRNLVDDDKDRTCSTGLHFASKEYMRGFRESNTRLVCVKVNPRDVVSIPSDYNNSKGRACEYLILEEIADGTELEINAFGYGVSNVPDESDDDDDDDVFMELDESDDDVFMELDEEGNPVPVNAATVRPGKISDETARKFLNAMANKATLTSASAIAGISRRDGARIRDREGRWATFAG